MLACRAFMGTTSMIELPAVSVNALLLSEM